MLRADDVLAAELQRYLDLYVPAYEDGHLLVSGGLADQPAGYLTTIQAVRSMRLAINAKWDELRAEQER